MSLKEKTVTGLLWSSVDNIANQGINFIIGILLARILSPKEFGLIGMLAFFIAVSQTFIDSGFANALIRKKDCSQTEYSTVFFFNLAAGIIMFFILFLSSHAISTFFNEPELKAVIKVLALGLIIDSVTVIQRTILIRNINFKLQTRITIISTSVSGLFAIIMALKGYGVWSLVVLTLVKQILNSLLLWIWNHWIPALVFSVTAFKELFGFGSKLLLSGLIDTIYQNVYFLVIGKYFSAKDLGFYTRSHQFTFLPVQSITNVMSRVTYPVLSQIRDNTEILKSAYKKMIKSIMLISFVLMLGIAAVSEPMVITLIGEKWRNSVIYLQMLCFVGMFYPLHAINLNMLNVQGRSDLFLKLEIIKKMLAVPVIIIGVLFGIKIMITGMIINSLISYFLNSYWSGKFINYHFREQLKDIMPSFILASFIAVSVFALGCLLNLSYPVRLIVQVSTGALLFFGICELTKMGDYIYMKQIVLEKIFKRN